VSDQNERFDREAPAGAKPPNPDFSSSASAASWRFASPKLFIAAALLSTIQRVDENIDAHYVRRFGPPPRSLRVRANGAELHLLEWGDPNAQPVLMVHGMRAHARWFTPVGPAVAAAGFRALSLDLRGHGQSSHTPPYGPAVYSDDVSALVDELAFTRPILVGHSMGGGVAVRAAARLGSRLCALVIVDSTLGPPPRPTSVRPRESDEPRERMASELASWPDARARFKLRPGGTVADPELLDHLAHHALRALPDGRFAWCFDPNVAQQRFGRVPPAQPDTSAIRCPVISIWGSESPMLRRAGVDPRDVSERFPSAASTAVEIIAGAHHHVFLDRPEAFNEALLRYLRSV
jgi:esterase